MKPLLTTQTVGALNSHVEHFNYDREQAQQGIVHLGIGAFHRAHQAVFTNDLLALEPDWKITAVSLRSPNIRDELKPQDYLYHVVERSNQGEKASLIGVLAEVLVAPENPQAVIDVLASESTKVVTLTITEKGYCRDASGERLDTNNPVIVHDLENSDAPKSFAGFITAACKQRMQRDQPLTIISCDNLPSNGKITRNVVLAFAQLVDASVANWMKENVSFCNSMVDRIVPATTQADIDYISNLVGVTDNSAVITEPFKQWVIEDNFIAAKPSWDKVGAMFVENVEPFEEMKLRLLNGAHSCLAYVGFLLGHEFIHQAVNDEACLSLVKTLQQQLISTLDNVPDIDLPVYAETILDRFANESVPYKTSQVACDGSQKLPQRLVKPAEKLLAHGQTAKPVAFVLAAWCKFLLGQNHQGQSFIVIDPMAEQLTSLAQQYAANAKQHVLSVLTESAVCSDNVLNNETFIGLVVQYLTQMNNEGVKATLTAFNQH